MTAPFPSVSVDIPSPFERERSAVEDSSPVEMEERMASKPVHVQQLRTKVIIAMMMNFVRFDLDPEFALI